MYFLALYFGQGGLKLLHSLAVADADPGRIEINRIICFEALQGRPERCRGVQHCQRELEPTFAERSLAIDGENPDTLYNVACGYALVGEKERSLDCLERASMRGMANTGTSFVPITSRPNCIKPV